MVYVPYGRQAATFYFRVQKDARVQVLAKSLRDNPELKPHLDDSALSLFKVRRIISLSCIVLIIGILVQYGELSKHPAEARYNEASKWLGEHSESQMLDFADRLNKHFPSGPPLSNAEMIDVIAVTDSSMSTIIPQFYLTQASSVLGDLVAGKAGMEDIWTRK